MGLPPIVDAAWVADRTGGATDDVGGATGNIGQDIVLADVRWYLDGRSGQDAFEAGHIPGAIFVDLERDLATPGPPTAGRHPLPTPEAFAATMARLGISDDTLLIGYDDTGGGTAGRLVWMRRALGLPATLLDGGLGSWPPPWEQSPSPERSRVAAVRPRPWPDHRFATDADLARAGCLLDARSAPRYRGEDTSVDARAGHIPGARSAPWTGNLDSASGRFRAADQLRAWYAGLGATEGAGGTGGTDVICYCGSGVSACADLLALEHAGVTSTKLYVPSWSGWAADPARPAATGTE